MATIYKKIMTIQLASFLIKMEYIRNMWKPSNEKKTKEVNQKKTKKQTLYLLVAITAQCI